MLISTYLVNKNRPGGVSHACRFSSLHRDHRLRLGAGLRPGPGPRPACSLGAGGSRPRLPGAPARSEEHTSELQSLMRISYAVFCLKKKNKKQHNKDEKHTEQKNE